jgi:ribosomal protein S14
MNYIARLARQTITHLLPLSARSARCSGCGHLQSPEIPIVSGPGVYLCRSCFRDVAGKLTPKRPPTDGTRCHFCRQFHAPTQVGRAGLVAICANCLGLMDVMFEKSSTHE